MIPGDVYYYSANSCVLCVQRKQPKKVGFYKTNMCGPHITNVKQASKQATSPLLLLWLMCFTWTKYALPTFYLFIFLPNPCSSCSQSKIWFFFIRLLINLTIIVAVTFVFVINLLILSSLQWINNQTKWIDKLIPLELSQTIWSHNVKDKKYNQ